MKKREPKKTFCRSCPGSKLRGPLPPAHAGLLQAEKGSGDFLVESGLVESVAKEVLRGIEKGDEMAVQMTALPILELGRRVLEGRKLEARVRNLESRVKALEEKDVRD